MTVQLNLLGGRLLQTQSWVDQTCKDSHTQTNGLINPRKQNNLKHYDSSVLKNLTKIKHLFSLEGCTKVLISLYGPWATVCTALRYIIEFESDKKGFQVIAII